MAGSGRARRFRQARELKQDNHEQICKSCQANLTFGESHEVECDRAEKVDPWAEEAGESEEAEEEEVW